MKRVLVIGGGTYQVPLIKRIRELGHEAYCVDKSDNAPGFKEANGYRCIDILDWKECLQYAKELKIDGVATYGATITLPTVSHIGTSLNLPALPLKTSEIAGNKYQIKKILTEKGCNTIGDLVAFHNMEEALNYSPEGYPCVVKPSDGSGSKGVSVVTTKEELESALRYGFESARFGEIYIERFVDGEEFSVEAFADHGVICIYAIVKTVFEREGTSNSGISYGHYTPPEIEDEQKQIICDEIRKAVRILDVSMGSINFDVIVSNRDGKAYIIDCGIRIGQNLIASHIVPLSRGVSEMDMYISQTLGDEIDPEPKWEKCVATRLLIAEPGIIKEIKPMQQYIGLNGIVDIVMRKKTGDSQRVYTDKSDNCGWVICSGRTPEEANVNAENARRVLLDNIITE